MCSEHPHCVVGAGSGPNAVSSGSLPTHVAARNDSMELYLAGLNSVARLVGARGARNLDWTSLDTPDLQILRARMGERNPPNTANTMMAGVWADRGRVLRHRPAPDRGADGPGRGGEIHAAGHGRLPSVHPAAACGPASCCAQASPSPGDGSRSGAATESKSRSAR